jgi:N-acetylmuramic acid 6-phosphate etherase
VPAGRRTATDFARLTTEAAHPRAAKLDTLGPQAIADLMLAEETKALKAAQACSGEIGRAAQLCADRLAAGGRLIYVGAGTSGRLGTLDAVECVPTFGVPPSRVVPIIAGGPAALTRSVEGAEDNVREAEQRMRRAAVGPNDLVIGVAASGVTPFVRAALDYARFRRAATVFVTCAGPMADAVADVVVAMETGPEVIAGSTRLKAGTATKVALNAISTAAFVLLGKTYAGLMVDVRPTNAKLWARAIRIVRALSGLDEGAARRLIEKAGGRAKVALIMHHAGVSAPKARELLVIHKGSLRAIVGDLPLHSLEPLTDAGPAERGRRGKAREPAAVIPAEEVP